ncbi:MAG TPA: YicC family protein [Flavobacteriales bacterium]|nr:YicC family protein [Flavobacteriales bacterium]
MLLSMTGFGRAEGVVKDRKVTVEVRALNSKQLDLLLKLPAVFRDREQELRQALGEELVRGKVDVFVSAESLHATKHTSFDRELIKAYYAELKAIRDEAAPEVTTDLFAQVLRLPDVSTTTSDRADDEEWAGVKALVVEALRSFKAFRANEGAKLETELKQRAQGIVTLLDQVARIDTGRQDRTRERLRAKLADLRAEVDESRFEQELIYYLEKLDITEEKVRLSAHCGHFAETLALNEPQGRKLGFIAQEMGREINTIGSKANDAAIARLVVQMKDELEKVKEQLLNVL